MKIHVFFTIVFIGFISACTVSNQTHSTPRPKMPATVNSADIDGDGIYETENLDAVATPVQGVENWIRDFYKNIKYPPQARENGISGILLMEISIDVHGSVTSLIIKKSLSPDCDAEAERAYWLATKMGYTPARVNGRAVASKIIVPCSFRVH